VAGWTVLDIAACATVLASGLPLHRGCPRCGVVAPIGRLDEPGKFLPGKQLGRSLVVYSILSRNLAGGFRPTSSGTKKPSMALYASSGLAHNHDVIEDGTAALLAVQATVPFTICSFMPDAQGALMQLNINPAVCIRCKATTRLASHCPASPALRP